jgi:predicted enzyme related to lactoylglutathione lyase
MAVLINIDVPDLKAAIAFYTGAFDLTIGRRFGEHGVELTGWPSSVYLLQKDAGSIGAGNDPRTYERHWTPVHLDVVVDDIKQALPRALKAGAKLEHDIRTAPYGKIAILADPFGHGVCLIQFLGRGYDEIAGPVGRISES